MDCCLSNEKLSVTFDESGLISSLKNHVSGYEYCQKNSADIWRLVYPHSDDPETIIYSTAQTNPTITKTANSISIHYPSLIDMAGRICGAGFTCVVSLAQDELHFTAYIENRTLPCIAELWFPMIGGLRGLGNEEQTFLLYPESAGRRIDNPVVNLADRHARPVFGVRPNYLRDLYPGRASMQWMGLYGPSGSLYIGSHDSTLQTTALNAMLMVANTPDNDSLSLGFIKYPYVKPGDIWKSEDYVVVVHSGPWYHDAERYRSFVNTYQDHTRAKADWVVTMDGLHDIILLYQHGRVNYRYADLPEICRAAKRGGLSVVKISGWFHGGHDNMYPDFHPSEALGGYNELVKQIKAAQNDGHHIVHYFHFVQMSPNSDFYHSHGEYCSLKGPSGNPFIDVFTWPSGGSVIGMNDRFQLINACVATQPWQDQVVACATRGLEMGSDCLYFDQTAGGPGSFLCFDKRHSHPGPAFSCGPGKTALAKKLHALVKAAGSNKALGAEYVSDVILQFFDFTIPFGMGFSFGGQHFGALYRYTFPEDILCTQYISHEDLPQLHFSFVMGYRFFLAPLQQCELLTRMDSSFVKRLADLNQLRQKYSDTIFRGRYVDVQPLVIDNNALVYAAFSTNSQAVVTVWNPTSSVQPINVAWPGKKMTCLETTRDKQFITNPASCLLMENDVAVLSFE